MKTDIEIAQEAKMRAIGVIAENLGLTEDDLELYGKYKAKISLVPFDSGKAGKLILITSINPTPAGVGKTTVSIGLADALRRVGKRAALALREPSLGPVMGMKGGATGGGYGQVIPMADINLHFTGDIHAITVANNLISAVLDNHIYQGNVLGIDQDRILWHRVLDVNDRVLRQITVGEGSKFNGIERQDTFDITVASEIMAVLCLADSLSNLKERLSRILLAYTMTGTPVTLGDLGVVGAVALLLKDAIKPNLVQTLEGTPAFVHGGPFANIAHGCNSVVATQSALMLSDYAVTEAGFGSDLGGEKFLDIKTRQLGKKPDVIVIVATVQALKYNGGVAKEKLVDENLSALKVGFENLRRHIGNMQSYRRPVVVAINRFSTDTKEEIEQLSVLIRDCEVQFSLSTGFEDGSLGVTDLAEKVIESCETASENFQYLYSLTDTIEDKIEAVVTKIYHGSKVNYSKKAKRQLEEIKENGWTNLPVCLAKTQYSFSDDPKVLGAPEGFTIMVRELVPKLGAGFIVALLGKTITMPGLPKEPAALHIDISDNGEIFGLS